MKLDFAQPEEVGMDSDRLQRAVEAVEDGLTKEFYTGASFLVARKGKVVLEGTCGWLDIEKTRPVSIDSIFDLASLTKPMATASSILHLLEQGKLYLTQPIGGFFPKEELSHLSDVTLHHLLTHTSGLPAWRDMYSQGQSRDEAIDAIFHTQLENQPGTSYTYSCLGYIMLGFVVEAVSGQTLDKYAGENIFSPLGMTHTQFKPDSAVSLNTAVTANCPARKRTLVGEVHDGNAWALGGVSGNAGLFSNVKDIARYCQMILAGGLAGRTRLFSPLTVDLMTENQIDHQIGGQTIGWFTSPNDLLPAGDLLKASIGHSGFTGTSVVIDTVQDLYVVLLTNRVTRNDDGLAFRRLRRVFHNLTAQAIVSK